MVLVVGCPRSGTTLMGALLGAHSACWDGGESFLFHRMMTSWPASINPSLSPLVRTFFDEGPAMVAEMVARELAARDRSIWVDHTPFHVELAAELLDRFPNARVVHVIRDGRAVCASLRDLSRAGQPWAGADARARARLWQGCVEAGLALRGHPRVAQIRYEALVSDPPGTAAELCLALGLSYEDQMLDALTVPHAQGPTPRAPLARRDAEGRLCFQAPGPSWDPSRWTRGEHRDFMAEAGGLLAALGYG